MLGMSTKHRRREIEASEARARGLIADILPLIGTLPDEAVGAVAAHLEEALKVARAKANGGAPAQANQEVAP